MKSAAFPAALSTVSAVTICGLIGHQINKKKGARIGAIVGSAAGAVVATINFCGMFGSEEEKKMIDREQRPKEIAAVAAGGLAGYVATTVAQKSKGSAATQVASAAVVGGIVNAISSQYFEECPKVQVGAGAPPQLHARFP